MDITYLGHSGFAARTDARLLVFDHLGEGLPDPAEGDRAIAFVSHAHSDHFHPIVSRWLREGRARLVVGMDVRSDGESMRPGEARVIDGARVEAFG